MVLGFFEMTDKDRPPEDIWLDEESLARHFRDLKTRSSGREPLDEEPMMQNELTKGLR